MRRRAFLFGTTAMLAASGARAAPRILSSAPFGPDEVRAMARDLARRPFVPRPSVPQAWQDLTYDQYRSIWFDSGRAVWRDGGRGFEIDLLHPGLYYPRAVDVAIVAGGRADRFAFDVDLFKRTDQVPDLPLNDDVGFSGLRLRHVYPGEAAAREFCVFQGASYFRAIGAAQVYGLSARGLALRTGDAEGEEFPEFVAFWVEQPIVGDETITVHALMDGPSVAGAYRFVIRPGAACAMDVEALLYPRVDLSHVGIAPLTSMFLYDETNRPRFDDFRPAIHDSDGLLIRNGNDEMLWRPLANPASLQVSSFVDDGPRGFGLMQRADKLSDFADLEAHYHLRPSLWIEPSEDWGRGVVRLVEIPSDREIYDNIVAYWRPQAPIPAGSEARFSYRMTWGDGAAERTDVARVLNTHIGRNFDGDRWLAAIDFASHPAFEDGLEDLTIHVSSASGDVSAGVLQHHPETEGVRLAFTFDPGPRPVAELRAQLRKDGVPASEVWLYRWTAA